MECGSLAPAFGGVAHASIAKAGRYKEKKQQIPRCKPQKQRLCARDDNTVEWQGRGRMQLSPKLTARFEKLQTSYPVKRSALIPMLIYGAG